MNDVTDEEYFGELKLMFQTKGWAYLIRELTQNAEVINNLQTVKDERDLDYRRGQLAVIGYMLNLPQTIEHTEAENASVQ